jgi:hypothetical protein
MTAAPSPAQRRLPPTVYILAFLLIVKAAAFFAAVLGANIEAMRRLAGTAALGIIDGAARTPGATVLLLGVGAILIVAALALLQRRRAGWLLAMVTTGVFVAIDIYGFLTVGSNHLWMALNVLTVFYLNQADVRAVVGVLSDREAVGAAA